MDTDLLLRKIERLQKARQAAENILEAKAKELWEAKQALEEKVVLRTKELQEAKENAEKAQLAEKQFLANMSHEIRTPLNAVVGMAHLLEETNLDKEQLKYITNLKNSANILQSLISDILDLSKIDAGKFEVVFEDFNLKMFSENLIALFKASAESKNNKLQLNFSDKVHKKVFSDTKLLNQVLINLLGNAIKFTDNGDIDLDISVISENEDFQEVLFSVRDTGIGISEEKQKTVFQDFMQANSNIDRTYGGTGLGLAIAKKIINLLDGELKVNSKLDEGSEFFFVIKLEKSKAQNQNIDLTNQPIEGVLKIKTKILVVEDNLMNQFYLQSLLDKWQLKYDVANNGLEALEHFSSEEYDLVLMDHQMPLMDGFEATAEIRKTDKETPIIALTASSMRQDREHALSNGFTDFLTKPYQPDQLHSLLSNYLT